MNKGFANIFIIVAIAVAAVIAGFVVTQTRIAVAPVPSESSVVSQSPTICTQDAKLCPDGSYVGRTGPKCEFKPCPTTTPVVSSGITGIVTLGPTCPVARTNDKDCADKPYQFGEFIINKNPRQLNLKETARFTTNDNGQYALSLPPGNYTIEPGAKVGLDRQIQYVTVKAGVITRFDFTLDTGIR